jgi:hypothetical protein
VALGSALVAAAGSARAGGPDGYVEGGAVGWSSGAVFPGPPITTVPEPGRVPLQVESDGPPQVVGVYLGESRRRWGRHYHSFALHQDFCRTPCQLFALPGEVPLFLSGPGISSRPVEVGVPPNGLRVRMGAPSAAAVVGGTLFITFGGIATTLALVFLPIGLAVDDQGMTIAGGVLGAGGVAMLITGIVLVAAQPYGVMWSGPPLGAPIAPAAPAAPVVPAPMSDAARPARARIASSSVMFDARPIAGGGALLGATLRF